MLTMLTPSILKFFEPEIDLSSLKVGVIFCQLRNRPLENELISGSVDDGGER